MIKQLPLITLLLLLLGACTANTPSDQEIEKNRDQPTMVVYRAPTWGCCGDWIAYVQENGYSVDIQDTQDLNAIKNQYQIPVTLQSCHTAIVDGYIIEGHVPVADIKRLLSERPKITGLAVPGMPVGSPGMEVAGQPAEPFDVIAFDAAGNWEIFASYNN